jgi:hypothetical protein
MVMSYSRGRAFELITVGPDVIRRAESEIESCEHCANTDAEIPFDWLLAEVTGKCGPYEFMLSEPARCPKPLRGKRNSGEIFRKSDLPFC